jgi:hypothetical protein
LAAHVVVACCDRKHFVLNRDVRDSSLLDSI